MPGPPRTSTERPARKFRGRYEDAICGPNALTPGERMVAMIFARFAGAVDNRTGEQAPEDVSWVHADKLLDNTGVRSLTTLRKHLTDLNAAGWLHQVAPARQHYSPRYRLTIPADPMVRSSHSADSQ